MPDRRRKMNSKIIKILALSSVLVSIPFFLGYVYYADVSAIENSEVSISDAGISEIGLKYCRLRMEVEVNNTSPRKITDLSVKFDIYLTDNHVGNGYFSEISVPAHSSRTREMTVTIYYAELTGAVLDMLKEGRVTVTMRGELEGKVLYNLMGFSQTFNASYSIV